MLTWDRDIEDYIDRLDAKRDAAEDGERRICPECGYAALRIVGHEGYGADRDGRRGVETPIWYCDECGYEQ